MNQVYVEKIQSEVVTPELAVSLQKIGFVTLAGLPGRSLAERSRIYNPFDIGHVEAAQKTYKQFADNDGLYIASTEHIGKEEVVGFALVRKTSDQDEGLLPGAHIEQWAVLPCTTINPDAICKRLLSVIQDDAGSEQSITTVVLEEQFIAFRALHMHGFVPDEQPPEMVDGYFGEGTMPVVLHALRLPGLRDLASSTAS